MNSRNLIIVALVSILTPYFPASAKDLFSEMTGEAARERTKEAREKAKSAKDRAAVLRSQVQQKQVEVETKKSAITAHAKMVAKEKMDLANSIRSELARIQKIKENQIQINEALSSRIKELEAVDLIFQRFTMQSLELINSLEAVSQMADFLARQNITKTTWLWALQRVEVKLPPSEKPKVAQLRARLDEMGPEAFVSREAQYAVAGPIARFLTTVNIDIIKDAHQIFDEIKTTLRVELEGGRNLTELVVKMEDNYKKVLTLVQ